MHYGVRLLGCVLALCGSLAQAQSLLRTSHGKFQSCASSCVTGAYANGQSGAYAYVDATHATAMVVQATIGTTATVTVEQSLDDGATWTTISGSTMTATGKISIATPVGWYRTNITAYTSGAVTTWFTISYAGHAR